MHLSLRARLLALISFLLLLAAMLVGASIWVTAQLAASNQSLSEDNFDPMVTILSVQSEINGARALYLGFQVQSDPLKRSVLRQELDDLSTHIDQILSETAARVSTVDKLQEHMVTVYTAWREFRATRDGEMIPAVIAGDLASAQRLAIGIQAERYARMTTALRAAVSQLHNRVQAAKDASVQVAVSSRQWLTGGLIGLTLLGGSLAWWLVRQIARRIEHVNQCLGDVVESLSESANLVSTQSQNLAQGASRQAAALEETSSSLTELGATGSSTAAGTVKVDELARSAGGQAEQGAAALVQAAHHVNSRLDSLATAVAGIQESSRRMSQVVSGIDSISVQINLLALNASVEAARAGDAGAGFAVVADEVRNLAQRSAQEVSATAEMIEANTTAVQGIKQISDLIRADISQKFGRELPGVFAMVVEAARTVAAEAGCISLANQQQSDGLTQIGQAMSELDGVIQGTAATSEEVAATAEELNSQVITMQEVVAELRVLVSGQA